MEELDIQQLAHAIAKTLNESSRYAIQQIEHLIVHLGLEFVQAQVEETQRIEANGGLTTKNGKRRRTLGGVFFHVVKSKLTPDQRALVFPPIDWKKRKAAKKRKSQVAEITEQAKIPPPSEM
jgi:hypothetical protein